MVRSITAVAAALVFFQTGCVPPPEGMVEDEISQGANQAGFPGLDAGASQVESLHFRVHAYGDQAAGQISTQAESDFSRLQNDINLVSFQPSGLFEIVVYGSQDEYRKKTGQRDWSYGVSVGNTIYAYISPRLNETISHQMTHLIFSAYVGSQGQDLNYRWINEGLAVFEEDGARQTAGKPTLYANLAQTLPRRPIPLDQLLQMAPASEDGYETSLWYAESESLVAFMIRRNGSQGFYQFLTNLKNGQAQDAALAGAYSGVWANLNAAYQAWLSSLP